MSALCCTRCRHFDESDFVVAKHSTFARHSHYSTATIAHSVPKSFPVLTVQRVVHCIPYCAETLVGRAVMRFRHYAVLCRMVV
jgi:hypothetical protein